jgi:hypothetical protein
VPPTDHVLAPSGASRVVPSTRSPSSTDGCSTAYDRTVRAKLSSAARAASTHRRWDYRSASDSVPPTAVFFVSTWPFTAHRWCPPYRAIALSERYAEDWAADGNRELAPAQRTAPGAGPMGPVTAWSNALYAAIICLCGRNGFRRWMLEQERGTVDVAIVPHYCAVVTERSLSQERARVA